MTQCKRCGGEITHNVGLPSFVADEITICQKCSEPKRLGAEVAKRINDDLNKKRQNPQLFPVDPYYYRDLKRGTRHG
jgi:hypothetical protein